MKGYKIIAAAGLAVFLAACGANGTTTSVNSTNEDNEETSSAEATTEEPITAEDEYTGEGGVALTLPGGTWEVTQDNEKSTRLEQGDKTITAAIIDDISFSTDSLPKTAESVASRFSSTDAPADVLDFNIEAADDGTSVLTYTVKYTSEGNTVTLTTCTKIIDEHTAIVVDGIIRSDADDAETEMMKTAVKAAMTDKANNNVVS